MVGRAQTLITFSQITFMNNFKVQEKKTERPHEHLHWALVLDLIVNLKIYNTTGGI